MLNATGKYLRKVGRQTIVWLVGWANTVTFLNGLLRSTKIAFPQGTDLG